MTFFSSVSASMELRDSVQDPEGECDDDDHFLGPTHLNSSYDMARQGHEENVDQDIECLKDNPESILCITLG